MPFLLFISYFYYFISFFCATPHIACAQLSSSVECHCGWSTAIIMATIYTHAVLWQCENAAESGKMGKWQVGRTHERKLLPNVCTGSICNARKFPPFSVTPPLTFPPSNFPRFPGRFSPKTFPQLCFRCSVACWSSARLHLNSTPRIEVYSLKWPLIRIPKFKIN